ncbi:MAG: PAS domain S-box protein [Rhodocyclaceae bacterium]|jgi:PAS domain S-box-containing protein|nr:PAS domain S-box protein [Rhodocyclaceae bacterium]
MSIEFCSRLLEELPDALIVADVAGTIRIWNKKAEELFRFTKNDAIGARLDLIIPENLRKAHWDGFNRAVSSDTVKLNGKAVRTKAVLGDGSHAYMEIAFSLTHDEDGQLVGVTAVARSVQ